MNEIEVVQATAFGGPEVLAAVRAPSPEPRGGQVLVEVRAAAVNPVDLNTRTGAFSDRFPDLSPPLVLGWDFAGVLVDGTRVAGMVPWFTTDGRSGAYAERLVAEPAWFAAVPDGLDDVTAATVPLNSQTARRALDLADLPTGGSVLVTGASGGVGSFAVQLAVRDGFRVLGLASTGDETYVEGLGAAVVRRGDAAAVVAAVRALAPDGVDAVLDAAEIGPDLFGAVRDGGTFVVVNGPLPDSTESVRTVRQLVTPDAAMLAGLLELVASGGLRTRVADSFPLSRAAEAHRRFAEGGLRGRLVLTP